MDVRLEDKKIIFTENEREYSFDAHGEYPRPSIMPAISVGGKHLSNRSDDIPIEKHTAVQDVAFGNGMAAWYTQEFLPDGVDYKLSKKANIYIGFFGTGEEKNIYKGECYGDLCFYENDLFFNIGNKVAVYHIDTNETEILFKHSGIKKSYLSLHITPRRVFYDHWTHSTNNTMWYDRETKEIVNPHFDGSRKFFLDDDTILYWGLEHTWVYDVNKKKKKRFFSNKINNMIFDKVAEFFDIPKEYFSNYHSTLLISSEIRLENVENDRVFLEVHLCYHDEDHSSYEDEKRNCYELGLPHSCYTMISCDVNAKDIRIEAKKSDIMREEKPFKVFFRSKEPLDFPHITLTTIKKEKQ